MVEDRWSGVAADLPGVASKNLVKPVIFEHEAKHKKAIFFATGGRCPAPKTKKNTCFSMCSAIQAKRSHPRQPRQPSQPAKPAKEAKPASEPAELARIAARVSLPGWHSQVKSTRCSRSLTVLRYNCNLCPGPRSCLSRMQAMRCRACRPQKFHQKTRSPMHARVRKRGSSV